MVQITFFTLLISLYPERVTDMIRYTEICITVGAGIGPFIGSLVFKYLDYDGTMYLFGFLNIFAFFLCWIFIPKELNKSNSSIKEEEND